MLKKTKENMNFSSSDSRILKTYLADIHTAPLLGADEEHQLFIKVKQGDVIAKERLIKSHLKFVVSIARLYSSPKISIHDLINEGNIGLIHAVEKFDETRGFKLITFAVWSIRQMILRYIRKETRLIRLPNNQIDGITKINRSIDTWMLTRGITPSHEEISESSGIPIDKIREYLLNSPYVDSLDHFNQEHEICLLDRLAETNIPPTDHLVIENEMEELIDQMEILPPRTKLIIKLRYGVDGYPETSLENTARRVKLSKERTRQIKYNGLSILRAYYLIMNAIKRKIA